MKVLITLSILLGVAFSHILPKSDDEDAFLTVPEIIAKYGYPVEEHHIVTVDGYILTLHRIPYGKKSNQTSNRPLLLQHGLLSSSADWVITGVGNALGYYLADDGYDVWLPNTRGNRISRNHTYLNPDTDSEYWQYSWHQIALYDLSRSIDYILETTGQDQLYHVGHSQGTTTFYVLMSEKPEYNDKIKVHISLSPVAYMTHMYSPMMHIIAFWNKPSEYLMELMGYDEFLPNNELMEILSKLVCSDDAITQALCTNSMFAVCGFSVAEMNATLIPILNGHTPAGASSKQLLHYGQEMNSGHFRQYDFGMIENLEKYGSIFPPDYHINKITADTFLIYSRNDWLSGEIDVLQLYDELPNCKGKFLVADEFFNHLDFMYGINAPKYVYNTVSSLLSRY